jgi:hypothetical protein
VKLLLTGTEHKMATAWTTEELEFDYRYGPEVFLFFSV